MDLSFLNIDTSGRKNTQLLLDIIKTFKKAEENCDLAQEKFLKHWIERTRNRSREEIELFIFISALFFDKRSVSYYRAGELLEPMVMSLYNNGRCISKLHFSKYYCDTLIFTKLARIISEDCTIKKSNVLKFIELSINNNLSDEIDDDDRKEPAVDLIIAGKYIVTIMDPIKYTFSPYFIDNKKVCL